MNRRHLALLVRNDLTSRFVANAFGSLWIIALPVIQLALFAFVFGVIFKARIPGLETHGYVAFLALGMWPWLAFSEAVARGAAAITDSAALIGKVAIEPWLLVLARTIVAFALHAAGFIVVILVLLAMGLPLHFGQPWLLLTGWLLLFLLAFAGATLAAVVQVFFRDMQQLLPMLLAALMYVSPILYTFDMLPETMRAVFELSPLASVLETIRDPLLWDSSGPALPRAALGTVVLALPVWWIYRRLRPHLEDFL